MTLDSEDEGMDLEPSLNHEEKEQQVPKRKVKARIGEREKILDDGRNSKHRDQNRDDVLEVAEMDFEFEPSQMTESMQGWNFYMDGASGRHSSEASKSTVDDLIDRHRAGIEIPNELKDADEEEVEAQVGEQSLAPLSDSEDEDGFGSGMRSAKRKALDNEEEIQDDEESAMEHLGEEEEEEEGRRREAFGRRSSSSSVLSRASTASASPRSTTTR